MKLRSHRPAGGRRRPRDRYSEGLRSYRRAGDDVFEEAHDTPIFLLIIAFLGEGVALPEVCGLLHAVVLTT